MTRDFLGRSTAEDHKDGIAGLAISQQRLEDTLGLNNLLLLDLRRELMKQNPDVMCMSIVQNGGQYDSLISDLQTHEISFMQGNKRRTAFLIVAWSTYSSVFLNLTRGNPNDGFAVPSAPISIYAPLESVYASISAVNGSGCPVNGNTVAGTGGLYVYAFTIPDMDEKVGHQY